MRNSFIFSILAIALIMAFGIACTKATPKSTDKGPGLNPPTEKPADNTEKTPPVIDNAGTPVPTDQTPPVPGDTSSTPGRTFTGMVPPNWPESVPIMKGLEITTGIINPPPENVMEVFCYGSLKLEDVWNFYSKLPGWEKDSSKQWKESGDAREIYLIKGNETLFVGMATDPGGAVQMNLRYRTENKAPEKTE